MSDQQTLELTRTCRVCGAPIEYDGVGRPRSLCPSHYPDGFPPRLAPGERQHEVRRGLSQPVARVSAPSTAHDAAAIATLSAGTLRTACLLALVDAGKKGLTDFELGERVHHQQTSAGKRRLELQRGGLVEATPDRRPAPSGAMSAVWRATEEGRAKAREVRAS